MTDNDTDGMLQRWATVQARIAAACKRADRDPAEVTVVAVAKGFGPEAVEQAARCGIRVIGENRVQEARQKQAVCSTELEWHFIGHLQSNKARDAVRLFSMIHSVDSAELMERLDRESGEAGRRFQILLQVNVSGERSKFGMKPADMEPVMARASGCSNLEVCGLMTVPPFDPDPEASRPFFRALRALRDSMGIGGLGLSMGMSGDFEVAVEEGARWIRIGRGIFGDRPRKVKPDRAQVPGLEGGET
ncbi:MAG: YggS family pyridoxal phosphate enzyme [Lentisphaerae bacterium RIFOXYC12_FULL_60_16]|nr:MAG: YggS family pyridoxal phosphate enzyme [Lentisphaerae bacterium RIFOXYC12_FULL_60_16]OGV71588.1 MAG: YggS family pyridoxal phosphate enzyme [Lentisphaerae bacterium RIFOXYA12_FULL_60_10]OGV84367.1 MAG: YggS family pyridoxal phosphate enzyme [Lentisphaerae bacterium RIFOXYB12_FULL_60_10]